MAEFEFDLLGDPIPEGRGRRGRPEHIPTEEKRKTVKLLLAFGWTMERVAAAMNCTPPTLRKHYFRELKVREEMRARLEGALLTRLMQEAEGGNVGAIEKMFKRLERADAKAAADRAANPTRQSKPKLGKKEQRREDAKSVGGIFASPEPPKLRMN